MMNCKQIEEKMQLYADQELSHAEMEEVRKHISTCIKCETQSKSELSFKATIREKVARYSTGSNMADSLRYYVQTRTK